MLGAEQFYAALNGQSAQGDAWIAQVDELLAQHPYCHMGHLLRALAMQGMEIPKRKHDRVMFSVAAQIPGGLALHNTLEHGSVLVSPLMETLPNADSTIATESLAAPMQGATQPTGDNEPTSYSWPAPAEAAPTNAPDPFAEWNTPVAESATTAQSTTEAVNQSSSYSWPTPAEEAPTNASDPFVEWNTPVAENATIAQPATGATNQSSSYSWPTPAEAVPTNIPDPFAEWNSPVVESTGTTPITAEPAEVAPVELEWEVSSTAEAAISTPPTGESNAPAEEASPLASVLDESLAVDVPAVAASIFPFAEATSHLDHDDMEFVTTILNPLYREATSKTQSQNEAIEAYLDNLDELVEKLRNIASSEDYSTENAEDLAKDSSVMSPAIYSERLAQMHVQRGETALAIAMYQRLATNNPEKSAYFAGIIEGLKQQGEAQ